MKKVGLITYYGDNYGGVLQAYALQQVVTTQGFECELISNEFLYNTSVLKRLKGKWNNLTTALKDPIGYRAKRDIYHRYASLRQERRDGLRRFDNNI